ncbi:hypothetical protein M758_2G178900 [Ceratodon purpureus]|nr:hypothetical protein M758_2G178900 [Ceratodon purpureus]
MFGVGNFFVSNGEKIETVGVRREELISDSPGCKTIVGLLAVAVRSFHCVIFLSSDLRHFVAMVGDW